MTNSEKSTSLARQLHEAWFRENSIITALRNAFHGSFETAVSYFWHTTLDQGVLEALQTAKNNTSGILGGETRVAWDPKVPAANDEKMTPAFKEAA